MIFPQATPEQRAAGERIRLFAIAAHERYLAMMPEQKKAHDDAQRASFIRGMTTPCEHGVLDFEQCGDCRAATATEEAK